MCLKRQVEKFKQNILEDKLKIKQEIENNFITKKIKI